MHTKRRDVVHLVPHLVVDPLGGYITFNPAPSVAGTQTVATVLARLSTNSLQPLYRHICFWVNYPSSLLVLLYIPIYLLLKIARDQISPLFKSVLPAVEVDLIQLPRPRGSGVDPLSRRVLALPIVDGDGNIHAQPLEGMASASFS